MANVGGASLGIPGKDYGNSSGYAKDGRPVEDEFGKWGHWLLSLSQENARGIEHTREYREFLVACQNLELAKHNTLDAQSDFSFLQYIASDDIVLWIFEFLECQSLVASTHTCSRFRELADRSAARRVRHMAKERQLGNNMMLLRAKEQMEGIAVDAFCHVSVPTLLLSRRVRVSNSGDPDYNGIFYCTRSSANGFVFSKPRHPLQRAGRQSRQRSFLETIADLSRDESEAAPPGAILRCIIEKRFSRETILWYLGKEVVATEDNGEVRAGDVILQYSFWSRLMLIDDASPDMCQYPSPSCILATHGEGWQVLATTATIDPPTVELLD